MNLIEKNKEKFELYYNFLIEENKKYNLTAITDKEAVYEKHFNDSLALKDSIVIDKGLKICDVGSGAGFPGIPLKICFPEIELTIIEPTKKKVNFLQMLCEKLQIDVNIINARAEDISNEYEEKFDIVTARAVASANVLLELVTKICKVKGKVVLYKGDKAIEELEVAKNAIKLLSLKLDSIDKFELNNDYGTRNIIIFTKEEKTNPKYPRRYGEIVKKPL